MPSRVRLAVLAWVVAAAAAADPLAELPEALRNAPFELSADELHYDLERELFVARGGVTIRQQGRTLLAEWAAFNKRTGAGIASGDVELHDGPDRVRADLVEFEIDEIRGILFGGRYESERSAFRVRAAEIERRGENDYRFRDGAFTTCRCPDDEGAPPWLLRSESAEIEVEGYASARNTTLEIFGVPAAWLPWSVFPVKTERQTGLLFPELALGSFDGFEIGLPFFWAPREDVGLVLTPRYSTDWGFGGAAQLDYAFERRSEGEVTGAFYHDQEIERDTPEDPFERERWSVSGSQNLRAPGDLRLRADFAFASDNQMPFDHAELASRRPDRFLESHAALGRRFARGGQGGIEVGASFADDLQNPDDLDRDRLLLQRWPSAHLDWLAGSLPGARWLVPSIDVDYAWFQALRRAERELPGARVGRSGAFLDTGVDALTSGIEPGRGADPSGDDFPLGGEGDGRFQEGEPLIDRGHRLHFHPRLALPLHFGGLSLLPEVGWHQTFYDTRRRGSHERGFLTVRGEASTRLSRRFGSWRHVLEPRAGYALATASSQRRNALFVPTPAAPLDRVRALDLDALTRDEADRIERAHASSFGFGNYLYRDAADGGSALFADFRLLGLYDLEGERLDALVLDGRAFPAERADLRFHVDFDPKRGRVDEGLAEGRWSHESGVVLDAGYRWARRIPVFFEDFSGDRFEDSRSVEHIHQLRGGFGLELTRRWSLRYRSAYSIEGGRLLANRGLLEYLSRCECWALGLEVSQDRTRGVDATLHFRVVGLGGEPARRGAGLLDGFEGLW